MGFWRRFSAFLWFFFAVIELIFVFDLFNVIFLIIALIYWVMVTFETTHSSENFKLILGVLTAALWTLSLLFLF